LFVIKVPLFSFRLVSTSVTSNTKGRQAKIVKDYFTLLYQQKRHGVSKFTLFVGKRMVDIMAFARNIVYKFMS